MDDRDVDQLVRSALAAGVLTAGPHPDPDTLFRYHARELSAAEADAVQDHLAHCLACTEAVLDFGAFPQLDGPSDDDLPSAEATEAGWAEVQARLSSAPDATREDTADPTLTPPRAGSGGTVVPLIPRGPLLLDTARPSSRPPYGLQALAAMLLAGVAILGTHNVMLRRQAARPEADVAMIALTLLDDDPARGAPEDLPSQSMAPTTHRVTVSLPLARRSDHEPYTVVVYDARTGQDVLRVDGLHYHSAGGLTFSARRADLPDAYRARVLDARGREVGLYGGRLATE